MKRIIGFVSIIFLLFGLVGCSGNSAGAGGLDNSTIVIREGAENSAVNGSVIFKVLGSERRPLSTFGLSSLDSVQLGKSSEEKGGAVDDIVVSVDIAYSFNKNTLNQATQEVGGAPVGDKVKTLGDLLQPGTLLYVTGSDPNGGEYFSSSIVRPAIQTEDVPFAANGKWNYSLIESSVPSTGEVKQGSIIFRVSPRVKNLRLVMITPVKNAKPLDGVSVMNGKKQVYILPI